MTARRGAGGGASLAGFSIGAFAAGAATFLGGAFFTATFFDAGFFATAFFGVTSDQVADGLAAEINGELHGKDVGVSLGRQDYNYVQRTGSGKADDGYLRGGLLNLAIGTLEET